VTKSTEPGFFMLPLPEPSEDFDGSVRDLVFNGSYEDGDTQTITIGMLLYQKSPMAQPHLTFAVTVESEVVTLLEFDALKARQLATALNAAADELEAGWPRAE
jgi:hypothetical protein